MLIQSQQFIHLVLHQIIYICNDSLYHSHLSFLCIPEDVLMEFITVFMEFNFIMIMYRQIDEVATGSFLGPIIANIFVVFFFSQLFCLFNNKVDVRVFHEAPNTLFQVLKFTREKEYNRVLCFLDYRSDFWIYYFMGLSKWDSA